MEEITFKKDYHQICFNLTILAGKIRCGKIFVKIVPINV